MRRALLVLLVLVNAVALAGLGVRVFAQEAEPLAPPSVGITLDVEQIHPIGRGDGKLVYSAKVLCGPVSFSGVQVLGNGTYLTAINIHNPGTVKATFTKYVVIANPQRASRGKTGTTVTEALDAGKALELDCPDIAKLIGQTGTGNVKGFAVITVPSPTPLSITGVWTRSF